MVNDIVIHARKSATKHLRKLILIVCEGARTEPAYFESFPLNKKVRYIVGAGANTVTVVKEAIRIRNKEEFDEVWCVFDRDSFPLGRVLEAFKLARHEGINVAFSNESFELWYLLHFQYLDTAISRKDYCKKLTVQLGSYKKNDENMYQQLLAQQPIAIRHAKKLKSNVVSEDLAMSCPVTTVHDLVQRLNKLIAKQQSV